MARLEKEVKFKFSGVYSPTKQTTHSAGYDVCSRETISMSAGEAYMIGLGIKLVDAPSDYYLELHPRSSLRFKCGVSSVGIIDPDYRDEIKIIFYPQFDYTIHEGDRIGQLIPKKIYDVMDCPVNDINRSGGFGSTKK
jgi:dUTP pyrophosphatase